MSTSTSHTIWVTTTFELNRVFLTLRGWIALGAFAVVWYFLLRYPIKTAAEAMNDRELMSIGQHLFGQIGLQRILDWPVAELTVYWVFALFLMPIFTLVISADQTSSDRERGTLRFLSLRASRTGLFLGRFIGQMLIQMILITATLSVALLMALLRAPTLWSSAHSMALILLTNLIIVVAPFTAVMALLSASVRSPRLAILIAVLGWGILGGVFNWVGQSWPALAWLADTLPGTQRARLLNSTGWATLQYAWLPLLQTLLLVFAGQQLFKRISL